MRIPTRLADHDHPLVSATARRLTYGRTTPREKLQALFDFVRDEVRFGYPKNGDIVRASETIRLGFGQCNTKATLLAALARAVGLETRMHFSTIDKSIQRGIFPRWLFKRMPAELSHSWVEVNVEGRWRRIDAFINDRDFYRAGRKALRERGWRTGFSISCEKGEPALELDIDDERFVQMGAVTGDHGIYRDPADYYRGPLYLNRPGMLTLLLYRLVRGAANRKVARMREGCTSELCTPAPGNATVGSA